MLKFLVYQETVFFIHRINLWLSWFFHEISWRLALNFLINQKVKKRNRLLIFRIKFSDGELRDENFIQLL